MRKIILAAFAIIFTSCIALAGSGKTKHKNSGKGVKKETGTHAKKICLNRPGCICN